MNIQTILLIAVGILIAAAAIYILTAKSSKEPWKEKTLSKIKQLNSLAGSSSKDALKSGLNDADKLLDFFLKSKRLKGETLGERLKNAQKVFSREDYNALWNAHKLRNKIAHEIDFETSIHVLQSEIKNITRIVTRHL